MNENPYNYKKFGRLAVLIVILFSMLGGSSARAGWWNENLKPVGSLGDLPGMATDLELDGARVYLMLEGPANADGAPSSRAIGIVDAANPRHPKLMAVWKPAGALNAFAIEGGRLYAAESRAGQSALNVYDMTHPESPRLLGGFSLDAEINRIKVAAHRAYLILDENQLLTLDFTDPSRPAPLSSLDLDREWGPVALQIADNRAFLAHDGGIEIFDLSAPQRPRCEQILPLPDPYNLVVSMAVEGNRLIVANYWELVVFDWRHPADRPATINALGAGQYSGGGVGRIALSGSKLFVPLHANGVQAIAQRNPAADFMTGYYLTPGSAHAVATRGDLVFMAAGWSGLIVLDSVPR